eukprot:CAMPEP_0202944042 /NCGR_PEP_ID=MMETSP1395-20130829/4710_1 /ASSEMBLY_ACC=CAM_ASM_000871 /TAXON_ID=5961 /ORGANISM="Blepharisma japonicum, Strain Stock R1072" /LENGTH=229 /DNA_ID=CAMNT_0049642315 /DNA_START=27 /DNA_END=716 /DNA_ORIENTATION=+
MMGGAGGAQGPPIPKTQLVRILSKARKLILRRMLEAKRANIEERIQFYKNDADKYKECIMKFAMGQPAMIQGALVEVCQEQNVNVASIGSSIQQHMFDPEVQNMISLMQTITGDMCEGQPFPEEFDKERFKEILRIQTAEVAKYTITDQISSMVAQTASADEIYQLYGLNEIQLGALAIKYESDPDTELRELKERWNEVTRMDLILNQAQRQVPQQHQHGPGCQHNHSH